MAFATTLSTFTPFYSLITGITQSQQAVITFSESHSFTPGEVISIRVSKPYGMTEINNMQGIVLSTTPTTVTMEDIDSSNFNAFVYPPIGVVSNPAMAVPSASGIIPGLYPPTINLEDAFDNVPIN